MRLSLQSLELTIAVAGGGRLLLLWIVIGLLLITLTVLLTMVAIMRHRHRNRHCHPNCHLISRVINNGDNPGESLEREAFENEAVSNFWAIHKTSHNDMFCPLCNGAFSADQVRCPRDGRRLVLRSEIESGDGRVCPICLRGFTESLCFCPHDGAALVVADPQRAMRLATAPGDSSSKICPRCRTLHEYRHMFCSKDGSELRILN